MSWEKIMRRVLPPIGGVLPHITSSYGATDRPPNSTNPHEGIDFNYRVPGQRGINLAHPAIRSPVTGIATNAGEGTAGRIAIRDSDGFIHEILHSHRQHVTVGDPVVAGQLIGTMGNTGVNRKEPERGPHHVHYQLRDREGRIVDPNAYWDQQGPIDPNPAPPTFLGEHQRYLRILEANPSASANLPAVLATPLPRARANGRQRFSALRYPREIRVWLCDVLSAALRNAIICRTGGRRCPARYWKRSSTPGQASCQQGRSRRIRSERSSPAT